MENLDQNTIGWFSDDYAMSSGQNGFMSDPNQSAATTIRYQVALLHYNDGLSRQMMLAEAVSQTLNCI